MFVLQEVARSSSSETLDKGSIQAKPNSQVEQSKPEQDPPSKRPSMFDLPDLPLDGENLKAEDQFEVLKQSYKKRKVPSEPKAKPAPKKTTKPAKNTKIAKNTKNPAAKAAPKATPKKKATGKAVESPASSTKGLPTAPKPGSGTVWLRGGKIHRSDYAQCWRVFVNKQDRCDKKVYWKGDEQAAFKKACALIPK